ncbi:hypothetical protein, partial [Paenibacillus timonensis]|uniref:hypothetical protein n=1 Tax=Paenibacillus timonensis TaxID=225915 RepID=UPI0022E0F7F4
MLLQIGLDIGSTTAKIVALHEGTIVHRAYARHYSDIRTAVPGLWRGGMHRFPEA